MASAKQLHILTRGPEFWNDWRRRNPGEEIDLSGTDLRGIQGDGISLSRANLEHSNLNGVNLFRADLSKANLSNATLMYVHLREAKLHKANLYNSTLRNANLSHADLSEADLRKADLRYATLTSANLSLVNLMSADLTDCTLKETDAKGAIVGSTIFGNIDLKGVRNLDTFFHKYSSIIDPLTLTRSGKLPISFLRGCGLSEKFISNIPDLFLSATRDDYHSCFISYSHKDKNFAKKVHDSLQSRGIRCWRDERDMGVGQDIYEAIQGGIFDTDKVLLCCSKHSLSSAWVDNEIALALKKERENFPKHGNKKPVLLPLNIDNYMFSADWQNAKKTQIQSRLAADFVGWDKEPKFRNSLDKVISALKK